MWHTPMPGAFFDAAGNTSAIYGVEA